MSFFKRKKSKLVCMCDMLAKAKEGKYAVAQININNMEWIVAALEAAKQANAPIILGVSEGAAKYMNGYKNVVDMVNNIIEFREIGVPVALHLDHGSYEAAKIALDAGFSSVMFDGSKLSIDENIIKTTEIVNYANKKKASVEAEVGSIGGEEDGKIAEGELADVGQCARMAAQVADISCLAAGIGNIHGIYPEGWKGLNFERLGQINSAVGGIPLVLHGGTGIPEEQIKQAISLGVSKINVNTECQLAFAAATRKYIEDKKDQDMKNKGFDPRKLLKPGVEAIKKMVIEKINIFGSMNKA